MYGFLIALGIFVSALLAERMARKENMNTEVLWGGLLVGLVCGLVGARLYHVLSAHNYYLQNPVQTFMVWQGGLGIFGAVFFGLLGILAYLKYKKEKILGWLDIAGVVMPLAQSIGRWGNYFNRELLPYAIYESIANLFLFAVLFGLWKYYRDRLKAGTFFFLYLIGYSLTRLLLNSFRSDVWSTFGFDMARPISGVVIVLSIVALVYMYKVKPK
jgi:phosphatidylglycerol:prolipoprotein diacylglycerol transferase